MTAGIYTARILTQPAVEPLTLAELKEHCRVAEDFLGLTEALRGARGLVEHFLGRALISQQWEVAFDTPLCTVFELPMPPIISVDTALSFAEDETSSAFSSSSYVVDGPGGRVWLKQGVDFPTSLRPYRAMVWTYTAGYGAIASAVPRPILHAIKLLAAHLYENREATSRSVAGESGLKEIPFGVRDLLFPYKVVSV